MNVLPRIQPIRLRLIKEPFDDPDYIFELKHDGFRAIAYIENGECHLVSRNSNHMKFDWLKRALSQVHEKDLCQPMGSGRNPRPNNSSVVGPQEFEHNAEVPGSDGFLETTQPHR